MEIRRIREAHYRIMSGEPEPAREPEPEPEPKAPVGHVTVPDDYQNLPWSRPAEPGGPTLRGLVKELGAEAINKAQALEVIRAAKSDA